MKSHYLFLFRLMILGFFSLIQFNSFGSSTATLTVTLSGARIGVIGPNGFICTNLLNSPGLPSLPNPPSSNAPTMTCTKTYDFGSTVTLNAQTPSTWGGACSGMTNTCQVVMRGNQKITLTALPTLTCCRCQATSIASGSSTVILPVLPYTGQPPSGGVCDVYDSLTGTIFNGNSNPAIQGETLTSCGAETSVNLTNAVCAQTFVPVSSIQECKLTTVVKVYNEGELKQSDCLAACQDLLQYYFPGTCYWGETRLLN